MHASNNCVKKRVVLSEPRPRVWRALTDSNEFGAWFQVRFEQPFVAGVEIRGSITHPGYEHLIIGSVVEKMIPERYFSYRWHPHAIDPTHVYSAEPMTPVEFTLEESPAGTVLTIVESGFERIRLARQADALKGNDVGWTAQVNAIDSHLRRCP